jgi:dipeptidyl aminopeptidase/acylaminoacyl peptidase
VDPVARIVALRLLVVLALAAAVAGCTSSPPAPSAVPSAAPSASAATPTTAPTPSPTPISVADGESWIAFQQFLAKSTVMLVRPDGSGLHSPTRNVTGGDQTNPDWSPDGSQLVFAVASGSHENLWVVNADGTGARLLADCSGACSNLDDPAWSPDGRTVLFSRNSTGADGDLVSTLEQVDVASGATEVLVGAPPSYAYAGQRWSPDGASIVLEVLKLSAPSLSADIEDVSLAVIDVASPTPAGRELLGSKRFPETAAWSPDGSVIVFDALEAPGASGTNLYAIRPEGTGLRQITHGVGATHAEVSPDGSTVLFAATIPGRGGTVLAQVPLVGGEIAPATRTEFIDGVHPRVRPVP